MLGETIVIGITTVNPVAGVGFIAICIILVVIGG